jgi:signal transduction histidine kinase
VVAFLRDITERKRAEKAILDGLQREILAISSEERRRFGQELHDGVGQQLTGLAYLASTLCEELRDQGAPAGELADKLADGILDCRRATQALAKGLVPLEIGAESLVPALRALTESVAEQTGIACSFKAARSPRIRDDDTALHLYRLVQEAVNNAVKHARAQHIRVALERARHRTTIRVCDDGVGIPADAASGTGTGLRIMRHRAKLIGGVLDVKPLDGGGTAVTCALPGDTPSARADANE